MPFTKGQIAWNKGFSRSDEVKQKISATRKKNFLKGLHKLQINENNPMWKGDEVSYKSLHGWISRKKGKAKVCIICRGTKSVQWASATHKACRNLNNYISLCAKCHHAYDKLHENQKRDNTTGRYI